jgi:hypothetical protein
LYSVEKTQHPIFVQILDLLQENRGDALSELSGAALENVFGSLFGTPRVPSFVLDHNDEQNQLDDASYDSPALVGRFRLQSVQIS